MPTFVEFEESKYTHAIVNFNSRFVMSRLSQSRGTSVSCTSSGSDTVPVCFFVEQRSHTRHDQAGLYVQLAISRAHATRVKWNTDSQHKLVLSRVQKPTLVCLTGSAAELDFGMVAGTMRLEMHIDLLR